MTTVKNSENKITLRMVVKYFMKKSKPYKWLILLSLLWSIIIAWISIVAPIYQTKLVGIHDMNRKAWTCYDAFKSFINTSNTRINK